MRVAVVGVVVVALVGIVVGACGPPPPSPCDGLVPGDDCFSDEALEQCQAAVDDCGAANVGVAESCPPQFFCP